MQNELLKNKSVKNLYESIKNDSELNEGTQKIQNALAQQEALANDPNARAKLYYQQQDAQEPCQHCPRYLNLVEAVNEIVEKVNVEDVKQNNEKLTQLSKLKFLYYLTKTTQEDGTVKCSKTMGGDLFAEEEIKKGKIKLAAEVALALPNITEVQYYATGGREVHYFYQGEAEENDKIIEVIMAQDKPTIIRYYMYDSPHKLPDLGTPDVAAELDKNNYLVVDPTVERENLILPVDVKIGKAGVVTSVTDTTNMRAETEVSYNQQKGSVALESKEGAKYLVLETLNIPGGAKSVSTLVNYEIPLESASESGLKVGSSLESKMETDENMASGVQNSQAVTLQLTDKDVEYFKVKAVADNMGVSSYLLGNKFKLGEGQVGTEVMVDREGNHQYGVTLSNQGPFKETRLKFQEGLTGERIVGINVGGNIDNTTTLSGEISHTNIENKTNLTFNLERNINSTESMVVTVIAGPHRTYNLLYQYQKKL